MNSLLAVQRASLSKNTHIAYAKGWAAFEAFCAEHGYPSLPASAEHVARFAIDATDRYSMGTVQIYCSAICHHHRESAHTSPTDHPTFRSVMRGLKRLKGTAPRQVDALRADDIVSMIDACDTTTTIGLRDSAILAVGFSAALRRSEIAGLLVEDIRIYQDPRRMIVTIRQSKTDQEGAGQTIAVPDGENIRPVSRLLVWWHSVGIERGPAFQTLSRGGHLRGRTLHHSDIPRIVKHYGAKIGLDPSRLAGHSLRAGFVTSAAENHARLDKIMAVTRHRNTETVMKYIRDADAFSDHALEGVL